MCIPEWREDSVTA